MKKLIMAVLVLSLTALPVHGATIDALSCSQGDVDNAYAEAADGDIIVIPAGDCSSSGAWTETLEIEKQVSIQGSGVEATILGMASEYTPLFHIIADNVRISDITFDGRNVNPSVTGAILVGDYSTVTNVTRDFRIDHNRFINFSPMPTAGMTGWSAIGVYGYTYGVIDSNVFEDATGEIIGVCADCADAWARPVEFGGYTDGTVFVEDNIFNYEHEGENIIDGNSGSRYVIRGNTINVNEEAYVQKIIENHETCATCACDWASQGDAGSALLEVYDNDVFIGPSASVHFLVSQRGGRALIYNNIIHGAEVATGNIARLSNLRSYHRPDCNAQTFRGYGQFCHEDDGSGLIAEGIQLAKTTLSDAIDSSQCPTVASVSDFPTYGGSILVGTEQIDYTALSGNQLSPCTRGANGTSAAAHDDASPVHLLIFGSCIEQPNNTYIWGNLYKATDADPGVPLDGVFILEGDPPDYSAYDIQSYAQRPENWQYRNDGTVHDYTAYPYPHPLRGEVEEPADDGEADAAVDEGGEAVTDGTTDGDGATDGGADTESRPSSDGCGCMLAG
jgi:hypothetical protein